VMGDGGFWHNGLITGVAGAVFNKDDSVLVVMNNGYSSATGQQDILSSKEETDGRGKGLDIEGALKNYVQQPVVTVMVTQFVGPYSRQIRVIGEAANPQALPFSDNMSLLDVMIGVGGLTKFAAGNRAVIIRKTGNDTQEFGVRIDRLLKDGDVSANVPMAPGDVLIIPQSFF